MWKRVLAGPVFVTLMVVLVSYLIYCGNKQTQERSRKRFNQEETSWFENKNNEPDPVATEKAVAFTEPAPITKDSKILVVKVRTFNGQLFTAVTTSEVHETDMVKLRRAAIKDGLWNTSHTYMAEKMPP